MPKIVTTQEFIKKAISIHGNNYSYERVNYKNAKTKVKIYCKKCKKYFLQTPTKHLSKSGCIQCGFLKTSFKKTKTKEQFTKEAKKIHQGKYEYSEVVYKNCRNKVKIYCKKCKEYFYQIPDLHLRGSGCPKCNFSKGEQKIKNWLKENKINYKTQKRFNKCKDRYLLPFDFYLPDLSLLIEYDGEQHFKPVRFGGISESKAKKNFESLQYRDSIKTNFCKINKIKLVRIPYTKFNKIENILSNYISN